MLNRENEAIVVLERLVNDFPKSPLAAQGGVQRGATVLQHRKLSAEHQSL